MNNLLAGTGIATVFVDHSLHILRFTPAATRLINLIQSDIGRPVGHLVSNLAGYDSLPADTQAVLDSLVPKELEVQTKSGVWYAMRILPYRTLDNVIEGAVITFVDVNSLKQAQESLRESEERFRLAVEAAPNAMVMVDRDGKIVLVNARTEVLFGYSREELLDRPVEMLVPDSFRGDHRRLREGFDQHPEARPMGLGRDLRARRKDGSEFPVEIGLNPVQMNEGARVLSSIVDVSARKRAEAQLRESEARLAREVDALTMLHQLAMTSVSETDLTPILGEIVNVAISVSGADFGNIQLFDKKTSNLRIVGQRGFPQWWLDFWDETSRGHGVCGTALERGERVIVEDVEQSPIFLGTPALEIQLRAGVRAVQSTPLVSRSGSPLGMFSTHYKKPQRPDERALRLLDLLARQAADIIERAQMEVSLSESEDRFRALTDASRKELEGGAQETKPGDIEARRGLGPKDEAP
jgi:PAS domain S-box-containing protein